MEMAREAEGTSMTTMIEKYDAWRKEYHPMALMNEAMAEAAWLAAYKEGTSDEREACAKVCDELANDENTDEYINGADWCSVRIRARGQA
jgi:hypothetical protein